jgi:DNA-binding beta-propeller fold protein YncE
LCGAGSALLGVCGPFTDVSDAGFCPFVLEIFYLGITTGTSPTTYDPAANVSRLQMAAFLSRSVDGVLNRGSRRAALRQHWTTQGAANLALTTVGTGVRFVESDGSDLWVTNVNGGVSRVRGSDGRVLEEWLAVGSSPYAVLSAMGRVFVTSIGTPGKLLLIDPRQPAGSVTVVASNLGGQPFGIAYDGSRIWTANFGNGTPGTGSVSIATPGAAIPWTVTNVSLGFSQPGSALYDGASIWVTEINLNQLLKLSPAGAILQTVTVGGNPSFPVFDGTNIWVPNTGSNSVSVVRASTGAVLRTLTGNGLGGPFTSAFDGQRVLVTSNATASVVSLWKAADLTAIGTFSTDPNSPFGACSDGIHFWFVLGSKLARF